MRLADICIYNSVEQVLYFLYCDKWSWFHFLAGVQNKTTGKPLSLGYSRPADGTVSWSSEAHESRSNWANVCYTDCKRSIGSCSLIRSSSNERGLCQSVWHTINSAAIWSSWLCFLTVIESRKNCSRECLYPVLFLKPWPEKHCGLQASWEVLCGNL